MNQGRSKPMIGRDLWWVLVQVPLIVLAYFLPIWSGAVAQTLPEWLVRFAGAVLVLVAVPMALVAFVTLGRYLTPFPRPMEHARLRDRGVYGVVRHPIYSAIILSATGWSMWSLSWPGVVFAAVLGLFFDRKAAHEEYWLSLKFASYPDYRKRVKKLIPWIY